MKILITSFFFCISIICNSQDIPSLKEYLASETDIKKKVSLYIDIAWEYMLIENDSSLFFIDESLQLARENNYPYGEVITLEMRGIYQEAVENSFDKSIASYIEAIEIAKNHNIDYLSSLNLSIGVLFERTDNFLKAKEYYIEAVSAARKANESAVIKIALINLGGIYNVLGDYDKGLDVINKSFSYPYVDDENDAAYHILGSLLMSKGQYKEALPHLIESVQNKNAKTDLRYKFHYSKIIENKLFLEDYSGFDTLVPIVENFYVNTEAINEKPTLANVLSASYRILNNYAKAFSYKDEFISLKDSINNIKRDDLVYDLEIKYQTDITKQALEKKQIEQKVYIFIAIAGLLLALLLGFFYYKNKKKNKLLAKQKVLLEATIDEKNALLKETHHRVKNSFQIVSSLLYLQSENIQDKEAQLAIKEAQNRVRSMVLIHQKLYNKDQLVGINTKEYIEDLTQDIFESHQFTKLPINYSLDVSPMVLDIETITPIGLILNELITNVLKHAFDDVDLQSKMHIIFEKKGENLFLKVSDNGKGLSETIKESSFGIKLIRALSKKLKATLTYSKAAPQGTSAILEISRFEVL